MTWRLNEYLLCADDTELDSLHESQASGSAQKENEAVSKLTNFLRVSNFSFHLSK